MPDTLAGAGWAWVAGWRIGLGTITQGLAAAPGGFTSTMDPKNHHLHKPVFIGEVKADGQFNVVWKTKGPVKAQPWSPFIAGNDKKKDEPEGK